MNASPRPRLGPRLVTGFALTTTVLVAAALVASYASGDRWFGIPATPTAGEGVAGLATVPSTFIPSPSPTPSPSPSPSLTPTPTTCSPASPALAKGAVPILYLHRVVAPPAAWPTWSADRQRRFLAYDVIPAAFAADLDWLRANGFTTILPRDLASHWDHGTPLPTRPVIITLDDGNPSWVRTVLPMLQERGMVAEFYLTLDAIRSGEITWAEVQSLVDAGMGIGAHDVHHVQLAGLGPSTPPASPETMWSEVHDARVIIGQHIGVLPDSMAYVGGGFDATLVGLVRKAGYTTARSIIRGIFQPVSDRYELRVVALAPHDDVIDPYVGELACGLPKFVAKITGQAH